MADCRARLAGTDKGKPVRARARGRRGDDFDDVAVVQFGAQRYLLAIDRGTDGAVADVAVDGVGEVDRRGPPGQRQDLALGREDVDRSEERRVGKECRL